MKSKAAVVGYLKVFPRLDVKVNSSIFKLYTVKMPVVAIHRGLAALPLVGHTVAMETATNMPTNSISCSHSRSTTNGRGVCEALQGKLHFQHICTQMTGSVSLISEFCSPTGRNV